MTASQSSQTPTIMWAQRPDSVWITVDLADIDPESTNVDLTEKTLTFSGVVDGQKYAFDLTFFKEINVEESKYSQKRLYEFFLKKKEEDTEDEWPRLVEAKGKVNWIKVDWAKWKDADEEEDMAKPDFDTSGMGGFGGGMGGMDLSSMMGGMGGMPGMGGMGGLDGMDFSKMAGAGGGDSDDSDDDDLPDLDAPVDMKVGDDVPATSTEEEEKAAAAAGEAAPQVEA